MTHAKVLKISVYSDHKDITEEAEGKGFLAGLVSPFPLRGASRSEVWLEAPPLWGALIGGIVKTPSQFSPLLPAPLLLLTLPE
ncbi:hypothetical protein Cal6303_0669 [Calothrix sp. PCC 6303]|nr:hypothetical protein Cal6303_0669 [Calothrix sp. PCC 6303]